MYSGLALLLDVHRPAKPNGYGVVFISGSGWQADPDYGAAPLKTQQIDAVGSAAAGRGLHGVRNQPPRLRRGFTIPAAHRRRATRDPFRARPCAGLRHRRRAPGRPSAVRRGGHLFGLAAMLAAPGDRGVRRSGQARVGGAAGRRVARAAARPAQLGTVEGRSPTSHRTWKRRRRMRRPPATVCRRLADHAGDQPRRRRRCCCMATRTRSCRWRSRSRWRPRCEAAEVPVQAGHDPGRNPRRGFRRRATPRRTGPTTTPRRCAGSTSTCAAASLADPARSSR